MNRGVSEYIIAPVASLDLVRALSELFRGPSAEPVGRTIAVIGAKGGVGASTIGHNVAWAIARSMGLNTVIVDLDLPFGTAGLNFNQDPPQGIADVVYTPDRVDAALVDRLLSKCADHLSLLAAPATLERPYDLTEDAFDAVLDVLRSNIPYVVLDVPHVWTAWSQRVVAGADEILVVAMPDLACLRNAKNLIDSLKHVRTNDAPPRLILNMAGIPKRPEINPVEFAKAIETDPLVIVPFEPQTFGTAANNGQMIAETNAASKPAEMFLQLAQVLTGRAEIRRPKRGLLNPIFEKLQRKKA
jgi:pilus assembly protein CpaE